jgi:glycosyltransferase involved in cell wall biosynthesis
MIVGIDASNIRSGGGVTHLVNILKYSDCNDADLIVVWSNDKTIEKIQEKPNIITVHTPLLNRNLFLRMFWQRWLLPREILKRKCDILFSPGGILPGSVPVPSVVLSQNLLPFEKMERHRFSFFSFIRHKMHLIKIMQINSMQNANGLIFLSNYAKKTILPFLTKQKLTCKIPHGIESRFFNNSKLDISKSDGKVFRLLYVSTIDVYKHQLSVAKAVVELRNKKVPVRIDFVGGAYKPEKNKLLGYFKNVDPDKSFLHYRGEIPFEELHDVYRSSDAFVFASTCENLPNILIEAMASGLPIACSNRGPMPEILKECGLYFDPENSQDIANILMELIKNPSTRKTISRCSYAESKKYSWEYTAKETFLFIKKVYQEVD